jgi:hypothetical protein
LEDSCLWVNNLCIQIFVGNLWLCLLGYFLKRYFLHSFVFCV